MGKMKKSEKEPLEFPENVSCVLNTDSRYSVQLDRLLSQMYTFVDVMDEHVKIKPMIESPYNIDHTILFHFHSVSEVSEEEKSNGKRKILKRKSKFYEKISNEDLCSVVVTGEWILKKQGIYGKGRERRGEEVTGAVHSPLFQRNLNKKD